MPPKILLVEDDPFMIDIYKTKFKEVGLQVEVVETGEAVLSTLKRTKPDLLILDIVLPNVDGWEIIEEIKKDKDLKGVKIVILSNLGQKKEVEKGLKMGAVKYLIKAHYTPTEIVEEIKKII